MAWQSTSHIHSFSSWLLSTLHCYHSESSKQNNFRGPCNYLVISILETGMKTPKVGGSDRGDTVLSQPLFFYPCYTPLLCLCSTSPASKLLHDPLYLDPMSLPPGSQPNFPRRNCSLSLLCSLRHSDHMTIRL